MLKVQIKEDSLIARLAANWMRAPRVAIVIGKTIYLWEATKEEFLNETSWVKHELAHVRQFQKHGLLGFMIMYGWQSVLKGYIHNRYEVEARKMELLKEMPLDVVFN